MDRFLKVFAGVAAIGVLMSAPAEAGSTAGGAKVFAAQCAACHGNSATAPQTIGPRLFGVVGRHAGASPGYPYTAAMRNSGLTWSTDELKVYLTAPSKVVHGTKMPYAGLHNPSQLDDLVTYLASLH